MGTQLQGEWERTLRTESRVAYNAEYAAIPTASRLFDKRLSRCRRRFVSTEQRTQAARAHQASLTTF